MASPAGNGGGGPDKGTRAARLATIVVLAALTIIVIVGTLDGGGLGSPWLWIGLALVPVMLWLVRQAGWDR